MERDLQKELKDLGKDIQRVGRKVGNETSTIADLEHVHNLLRLQRSLLKLLIKSLKEKKIADAQT